jgi:hypothetical protein
MPLARNAEPILEARLKGLKPDEMIMVSLIGRVDSGNMTVFADPGADYDWRWVRGLDICLWIGDEPNWGPTLKAIALCRPDYLCIWHQGQKWGATIYLVPTAEDAGKPRHLWSFDLDYLEWLGFQNRDFAEGRTYEQKQENPDAVHPRQHRLHRVHGGAGTLPDHAGG